MRYVVAHVISSPAGAVKTARLVISDVPAKTGRAEVVEALGAAGLAAGLFAEGGVPLGNHEVLAEGRAGWPKGIAGIDAAKPITTLRELTAEGVAGARAVTWARLTTPPERNAGKRVTLRLTPAEHSAYSLAAQREGMSLQEWAVAALNSAASAALRSDGLARAAAPASASAS